MQFKVISPSSPLARYVQHYWVLETDKHDGIVTERVVPTGNIEVMFHYRKPFSSISPSGESQTQHRAMISGINQSWFDVSTGGESGALAVTFYPGAAANFFNLPMMELEGKSLHLGDIVKYESFSLEEQLAEAANLPERIKIVENFLMKRLHPVAAFDTQLIQRGVMFIKKFKGQIRASELAKQLYVTPKTLERKFACYVGNTPKQFIKIVRFNEVMISLTSVQSGRLTQHAMENGYFDQAHFIKDFKSYSGYTPSELLSQNFCTGLSQDIGQI